ncbi:MAG: D-alanyl-D-alanine endopeptidase [Betaproteobacteria bacterium]|nr:MAG: D-alanyl-D-alanine endopeptidase [Betaproteobacteria bacterium]
MKDSLLIVLAGFIGLAGAAFPAFAATPADAARSIVLLDGSKLKLASASALVFDAGTGHAIYSKAADAVTPIASVTKLMTAMVVLDASSPMDETLAVDVGDIDMLKGSHSRLRLGTELSRREMLRLALMSSENRAASSLARNYPGGTAAFVEAMNRKAQSLGMFSTHFSDPTGLSSENVSTANDVAKMVGAAAGYQLIKDFTTTSSHYVEMQPSGGLLGFNNTNSLVRAGQWDIQLSKTGFIREAGKCLVMLANIASKPVVIVLLDSYGRLTRVGDANRVKHWLETGESLPLEAVAKRAKGRHATGPVSGRLGGKVRRV